MELFLGANSGNGTSRVELEVAEKNGEELSILTLGKYINSSCIKWERG